MTSKGFKGHKHTQETKDKCREAALGRKPWNKGKKGLQVAWNKGLTKETDIRLAGISKRISKSILKKWLDPKYRNNHSLVMSKRWKEPEYREMILDNLKQHVHVSPNRLEKKLVEILGVDSIWKFVGDGTFWIDNRNPDFINTNNPKLLIELVGCYWHGCSKHHPDVKKQAKLKARIKLFESFGYVPLLIWEHELKKDPQKVINKIAAFVTENQNAY